MRRIEVGDEVVPDGLEGRWLVLDVPPGPPSEVRLEAGQGGMANRFWQVYVHVLTPDVECVCGRCAEGP